MRSGRALAVTGAGGRLGRALLSAAGEEATGRHRGAAASFVPGRVAAWDLPEHDLDRPASVRPLIERDRPAIVIHAAAMTNVDQCAREPELAMARNGEATRVLAEACRSAGVGLLVVSTNEVFDGERDDGLGYAEDDDPAPRNPYGASKLAGEVAAREAFDDGPGLWIARTAWLYGPPGNDFPDKIVAAADRLPQGEALPVVADEFGSPTRTADLARAILELLARTDGGVFHLVNRGHASRLAWAERVLAIRRPGRTVRPISRLEFVRASDPPPWGVLSTTRTEAAGVRLRDWQAALDEHLRSSAGAEGGQG